jgi:predicted HTH transcriptional regulator
MNIGVLKAADLKVSSRSTIQVSTPGHIRSLLLDGSTPVLLIGAGASITSGIPAAAATAEKAARWAWCREAARSPDDVRIQRSDYWPWLCQQSWFSEEVSLADQYSKVIERLLGVRKQRRDFFERLISPGVNPGAGYRCLARILNEGWISTVLTTNFDHCLEDAKVLENKPHFLVPIKTTDDLIRFNASPADPQLVYLHGSVEHYSDKNIDGEVDTIEQGIIDRLVPVLRDHPIIVVGYRGNEPSVMKGLLLDQSVPTNNFAHGVFWCVRESEMSSALSPLVQELADAIGANFQIVPIKGFDELFQYDLWDQLRAAGALPTRRSQAYRPVDLPADMRPVKNAVAADLDQKTLLSRLTQYAKRLGLTAPEKANSAWLQQEAEARNLVTPVGEVSRPTLAGWLLFGLAPQQITPQATVSFSAKGPPHWIRKCFGDDSAGDAPDDDGLVTVEQDISGNLWSQLNTLTELLALVNTGFRLKEEVSRTAYPYDSLALKEVLVNALVHRDYDRADPVLVNVKPEQIQVTSPGGIVAEVAAQMAGQNLETVVKSGGRGIKGYRNPVITDLFYGGGQMDRSGSGLSDIWSLTINNNGEAYFGPDETNQNFVVVLRTRPEAVDEITNTAIPVVADTVRYATNLLPIEEMPAVVWHAAASARTAWELRKQADGLAVPIGHIQDGRFFTLYDLDAVTQNLVTPFDEGDVERLTLNELLALPNGENILLKLMNEAMFEHIRKLGLSIDYKRRRAFFPKGAAGERKITYQGRVKRATRTVVKARTRRGTDDVLYYEHKAFGFTIMQFGGDWAVLITPGYTFTRDGLGRPLGSEKINVLSTRRAARDFNPSVHHDVTFWASTLSEDADGLFALSCEDENQLSNYAPTILLSPRMPTVAFSSAAFGDSDNLDSEIDADLESLDQELSALATEESIIEKQDESNGD